MWGRVISLPLRSKEKKPQKSRLCQRVFLTGVELEIKVKSRRNP